MTRWGMVFDLGTVHRLQRLHRRLQDRERHSARRTTGPGSTPRRRAPPGHEDDLRAGAVQPLRGRALRDRLPDEGEPQARRRHRPRRPGQVHRLPGLHDGLPLRRPLLPPEGRPRGRLPRRAHRVRGREVGAVHRRAPSTKCTFCAHRVDEGLEPACVSPARPTRASSATSRIRESERRAADPGAQRQAAAARAGHQPVRLLRGGEIRSRGCPQTGRWCSGPTSS